ncbi:ribbon-helix-helix protein, CopG family [Bradyrhizobium sp. 2]|uniref:ribbon-helix-helix domain-containing protein n=1 Tax=unclassified Bradyrhizobium TaxID=2631580 RepID=UPI001FF902E0|nr:MULTISPECIES: ribbon-helix-helix domain-containing protein [unclassified Bradyrhizobium]MCK1464404.1 ribbon-helix-helix protein, CopG family [Bradyrhizobium sp. 2]
MQSRPNQFDGNLQVRVPKSFIEELDAAAHRRMVNRADFVRMALQDRLQSDQAGSSVGKAA